MSTVMSEAGSETGFSGDPHSLHSVLRERILEHLFVGDLLRLLWRRGIWDVEVLRSEFDAYGYDLVLSRGPLVRHVQLKAMRAGGSTRAAKLALSLAEKPSGCVICAVVSDDLEIEYFLWLGGPPDQPLPGICEMKIAKHTKGNAQGVKQQRMGHRSVPYSRFERVANLPDLLEKLFPSA